MGHKVTAIVRGGLGVQSFIIAHAMAQSWKLGWETEFVKHSYERFGTFVRKWDSVPYKDNIFRKINFRKDDGIEYVNDINDGYQLVTEKSFNTPDISYNLDNSIRFDGCFQSHKNFLGYDKEIQKLFEPSTEFINEIKNRYPELNNPNTLSLQVRRGDFINYQKSHPPFDISFIDTAIKTHGEYSTLFVFSNDVPWVKSNIQHPNTVFIELDLPDWASLWMMSLCTNNIIGNSTFAWWGAFLNQNPTKRVYMPSFWFGPDGPHLDSETMAPPEWIRIPSEYQNGRIVSK